MLRIDHSRQYPREPGDCDHTPYDECEKPDERYYRARARAVVETILHHLDIWFQFASAAGLP